MSRSSLPADFHGAVTPSDTVDVATAVGSLWPRALYVGTGGNIAIVTVDGTAVTYKNAASGSVIAVQFRRVNATNTTATDLVALY